MRLRFDAFGVLLMLATVAATPLTGRCEIDPDKRASIERQIQSAQNEMQQYQAKASAASGVVSQYEAQLAPAEQEMQTLKQQYETARTAEATRTRELRAQAEKDPRIGESQRRLKAAREAHEQLKAIAIGELKSKPAYIAAQLAVTEAEQKLVEVRDVPNRVPEQVHAAAMVISEKQKAVSELEDAAVQARPGYAEIRGELDAASKEYAELEREITTTIDNDSQRQKLTTAAAEANGKYRDASTKCLQIRSKLNSAKSAYNSANSSAQRMQRQIESLQRKLNG